MIFNFVFGIFLLPNQSSLFFPNAVSTCQASRGGRKRARVVNFAVFPSACEVCAEARLG